MSVLVPSFDPADPDAARFVPLQVEGEWTVWDAELQRYLVHQARWDAQAALDVAERLADVPYVGIWTWSDLGVG